MRSIYWIITAALLGTSGLAACASSDNSGGSGGGSGSGGSGVGGSSTSAGGAAGSGGSAVTGGAGGTGAGGTVTSAGGSGGTASGTDGTLCPLPAQALITDFSSSNFGSTGTLSGGLYVYPLGGTYGLNSDLGEGTWHISGAIGTYSGFGLYLDNCNRIDASAYAGISFKISGRVEQEGAVTLQVDTLNNAITAAWLNAHGGTAKDTDPGRCEPPATAPNQWAQTACLQPQQVIPVTEVPTEQSILWSDFAGGSPDTSVNPSDIVAIHWFFPNPPGAGTDSPTLYQVDITIDDLSFIKK
jgi:hypothetical protein